MPSFRSDEEVLELLQMRDSAAIAVLYDRYSPEVHRLVWRLLGADSEHDDLVQQVFFKLLRSAPSVREASKLRSFVQRVTINTVRSELRKRAVRRRFFASEEDPDRFEAMADADADTRELLSRTFAALDRMPVAERLVFTLCHIDDRTREEAALLSGCSLATLKRRLAKARRRFEALAKGDPILAERLRRQGGERS